MNGQAYIGKVTSIGLIPGADFIVHATVDCLTGGQVGRRRPEGRGEGGRRRRGLSAR